MRGRYAISRKLHPRNQPFLSLENGQSIPEGSCFRSLVAVRSYVHETERDADYSGRNECRDSESPMVAVCVDSRLQETGEGQTAAWLDCQLMSNAVGSKVQHVPYA